MIEILPNWHPLFVHFTIALLVVATGAYVLNALGSSYNFRYQARLVGRWNLWTGAIITIFTVIAGIIAFNTVDHDTPSHLVMKDHRLIALITAGIFIALAAWAAICANTDREEGKGFATGMVLGTILLVITGWFGSELVYRHGLGVMSLPDMSQHDHASGSEHSHGGGESDGHHAEEMGHNSLDAPASAPQKDAHEHEDGKAHKH